MATMDELAQELQRLRDEVRGLQARMQTQTAADPSSSNRVLSRRNLLRAAPIAAIGGAVVAMSAAPAAATVGAPLLLGKDNDAGSDADGPVTTTLESPVTFGDYVNMISLSLTSDTEDFRHAGEPLVSIAGGTVGTHPFGQDTLVVSSTDGATTIAADGGDGPVWNGAPGEVAFGTAVRATSHGGTSIAASTGSGQILVGSTSATTSANDAVTLDNAGTGRALYAQSHNPLNTNGAVTGVNAGPGSGVAGVGGAQGRGGQFAGGAAAVRLVPGTSPSHLWTGRVGDLMVDSSARLWFCTKANTSTVAATWKQLA
jgi:hypothetical protein